MGLVVTFWMLAGLWLVCVFWFCFRMFVWVVWFCGLFGCARLVWGLAVGILIDVFVCCLWLVWSVLIVVLEFVYWGADFVS